MAFVTQYFSELIPSALRLFQNSESSSKISKECESLVFTAEDLQIFIKMIDDNEIIKEFLDFDVCCILADKYLLAITFAYFIRAKLKHHEYHKLNFFSALYLAHKVEEDDDKLRNMIIPWGVGNNLWKKKESIIINHEMLWSRMNYRALVSKVNCENVIQLIPDAKIWKRFRSEFHAGAYRTQNKCYRCEIPITSFEDPFQGLTMEDDLYEEHPPKRPRYLPLYEKESTDSEESEYFEELIVNFLEE